jgi:hypothetical protein
MIVSPTVAVKSALPPAIAGRCGLSAIQLVHSHDRDLCGGLYFHGSTSASLLNP